MFNFLLASNANFGGLLGQYIQGLSLGDSYFAGLLLFLIMGFIFFKIRAPLPVIGMLLGGLVFALGVPIVGFNGGIAPIGGVFLQISVIIGIFAGLAIGIGLYYTFNRG